MINGSCSGKRDADLIKAVILLKQDVNNTWSVCCDELLVKFLENFSDIAKGLLMQQSQTVFMKYICVGVFKTLNGF